MGQRRVLGFRALKLADFQPALGHRISGTATGGRDGPMMCSLLRPASNHLLGLTWSQDRTQCSLARALRHMDSPSKGILGRGKAACLKTGMYTCLGQPRMDAQT